MLHQDKLSLYFLYVWVTLILLGCGSDQQQEHTKNQADEATILTFAQQHIGLKAYHQLYQQANDSLQTWCANRLKSSAELWYYTYQLDSLLCLNQAKDKLVGAILIPCNRADCMQDDVRYFYGVKIEEKWYFFYGPTIVLPQEQAHIPRKFSALHEQAVAHIFRAYLTKDQAGHWQINEKFFGDLTSPAACPYGYTCQTPQDWDKAYLYWVADNWKHRDKENQTQ